MTRRQAVVWALVALGLTYALLVGGAPAGVELPSLRIVSVVVTAVALGAWILAGRTHADLRPRSVLAPGLAACLGAMAISTWLSRSPRVSVEYLAYAILLGALYLLLVELVSRPWLRDRIAAAAGLVGVALALAYVALAVRSWVEFWSLVGHLTAPPLRPDFQSLMYGNPSPVLVLVVVLSATAIGRTWGPGRWRWMGSVAIAGLATVAAILTGTRAGIVAVAIGLVAAGGTALLRTETRRRIAAQVGRGRPSLRGAHGRAWIAYGVVGAVIVATLLAVGPGLALRFGAGADENRVTFYAIALRMLADSPIVGIGPGMWAVDRIAYTRTTEPDYYVPHAHDIYLQAAAEMGLLGLLAGVVVAGLLAWLIRDAIRDHDRIRRRWGVVATFCVCFFAADQLLDFHLNIPATLVALAIPVAILDATAQNQPRLAIRIPGAKRRAANLAGIPLVAAAVMVGLLIEGPALQHERAVNLANTGAYEDAAEEAEAAVVSDPAMPIYELTAGLAAASAHELVLAETDLRAFAESNDLPEAWLDLAYVQYQLGSLDASRGSLLAALRLGIQHPAIAMAAADLAVSLAEPDVAIEAGSRALDEAPSLAADPWWSATGKDIRDAAVNRALLQTSGDARWELALMSDGDSLFYAKQEGLASPQMVDVVRGWKGDHEAAGRVYAACEAAPITGPLNWCTRIASHLGDRAAAARFRRWAEIAGWGDDQLGEWRVAPQGSPQLAPAIAGDAVFYGLHTYRRFTPWNLLVPGLLHLVVE